MESTGSSDVRQLESRVDVFCRADGTWEAVRHGFSWFAFFVPPIWAWVNGMGGLGVGLFALCLILGYPLTIACVMLFGDAGLALDILLSLGVAVWIGSQGNKWRRQLMSKRGFQTVARSVQAADGHGAIRAARATAPDQRRDSEQPAGDTCAPPGGSAPHLPAGSELGR